MKWPWTKKAEVIPDPYATAAVGKVNTKKQSIDRSNVLHDAQTIRKWKNAILIATDPKEPNYTALAELYRNLMLDAHTVSNIESRILRVQRSKFVFKNDKGEEVSDHKFLLERPWFEQFISAALSTKFTGFRVLELWDLNVNLELKKCGVIPIEHIDPIKERILKEPGGTGGWEYNKGALINNYIPIGGAEDLGMLAELAPLILAKKLSMGSWLDLIEKFGVPAILANTANLTPDRSQELFDMLMGFKNNHVAVLQGDESFQIVEGTKSDPHRVFNEMIKRINSEISKRILGQDGTTDNKDASGTFGSLQILQGVADDRHESDKLFIQYLVNTELLQRLPLISSVYAPLQGLTFDWDESEDMDSNTFINNVVQLTQAGFQIDHEVVAEKTGIPITGHKIDDNMLKTNPLRAKKKNLNL